ncbi:MAG: ribosome maturation factor RimP [Saprospiraceae bacterium]
MFPLLFTGIQIMATVEQKIEKLLLEKFSDTDFADCFVIEIKLGVSNKLEVFVDADNGIDFGRCQKLSRYLEATLDTEKWLGETYILEVSSPGLSRPLKFLRQYAKHIGRDLEISSNDGTITEGEFVSLENDVISLQYEEKRKEGKKNIKEMKIVPIPFSEVKKAMVKIKF